jgi:hypothetical protein
MEAMRSVGEAEVRITPYYRVGQGSGFHEMEDLVQPGWREASGGGSLAISLFAWFAAVRADSIPLRITGGKARA